LGMILVMFLVLNFVSAQADPISAIGKQLEKVISPSNNLLKFIVGDTAGVGGINSDAVFISKILLLILLICLISLVLDKVPMIADSDGMKWTITIAVSLLGIRFLSGDVVAAILLPYTTMAVAMSVIIPFLIFTVFIYSALDSPTARRLAWAFFGIVFFFLWFMRYSDGSLGAVKNLYTVAAIVSLIMIFLDGTIRRLQLRMRTEKTMSVSNYRRYVDLLKEYEISTERYQTALRSGDAKIAKAAKTDVDNADKALRKFIK